MSTGPKVSRTGEHYIGLIQSPPNASPPPKEMAAAADGLVEAFLTHHPERYAKFALPGTRSYLVGADSAPRRFLSEGFPLQLHGAVTANTAYYIKMESGPPDVVRIEWLSDGQLAALSWLYLSDGKVYQVISDSAHPPLLPRSAFDPPQGEWFRSPRCADQQELR
jgi:hypothetical protein